MSSSTAPRVASQSFHEVTLPSTCFQNDAGVANDPEGMITPSFHG